MLWINRKSKRPGQSVGTITKKVPMKIKWNWGTKLTIAIILFMSLIFSFVYMSTQHPIDLVEEDYYPKGLIYQERIDEIKNAGPFANQVRAFQETDVVVITFPDINPDTGTITFYRPSDIKLDMVFDIRPDSTLKMTFPKKEFKKGKYYLKIYWEENNRKYYIEKPFYFN